MVSPAPLLVALIVAAAAALATRRRRWSGGAALAVGVGVGLWASGGAPGLAAWIGLGGAAVSATRPERQWGMACAWLVGVVLLSAGPMLSHQPLWWSAGAVLAATGSGLAGGASLVRIHPPGRAVVLVAAALAVALAMLLPGSSVRLGAQGLLVVAAALPLVGRSAEAGLAWVGAGLLAWGIWSSVLLASLGWMSLCLLPLLAVPWLGAALGDRPVAATLTQLAAILLIGAATVSVEVWTMLRQGAPY